jgi:type III secretory pathway lipoprotein EscJ
MLVFSGCGDRELLASVDSRQSVQVLVALHDSGIEAERERSAGRNESYSITVSEKDYSRALRVLKEYQLPNDPRPTVEELTRAHGFAPTSAELSMLRLDRALGAQVEELISRLPGVVDAVAVVRSHFRLKGRTTELDEAPSASLTIKYSSVAERPAFTEEEVINLVSQAIPGLTKEHIQVRATKAHVLGGSYVKSSLANSLSTAQGLEPLAPFLFSVDRSEKRFAQIFIVIIAMICSVCGIIIGYVVGGTSKHSPEEKRTIAEVELQAFERSTRRSE